MHDILVVLLEVFGGRVDGGAGENLHVVRGDRLAGAPSRASTLAERRLRKRLRRVGRVLQRRGDVVLLDDFAQLLRLGHVGHNAVLVV